MVDKNFNEEADDDVINFANELAEDDDELDFAD